VWVGEPAGGFGDQFGEQVSDLVAGQGDQTLGWWMLGALGCGDDREQGVGEHGQQGPAPPGQPATNLVFIEPGQAFAGLKTLLDSPSPTSHPDQFAKPDRGRAIAAVEGEFTVAEVAADEQPVLS
jgi:hypothetical protein